MLTVNHLSKTFVIHNLNKIRMVGFKDITFNVPEGQALGIRGVSGMGKSSLLKCIYRTYIADQGSVWFISKDFGEIDLNRLSDHEVIHLRRSEMGYVTQFLHVLPRVSTLDVVAEPLVNQGTPRINARKKAKDLLARLNIPVSHMDAYPVTFSGGEKQRVNLARAVISNPRLLLLDEPTASLDPDSMEIVLDILNELKQNGTTMVAIFHDQNILKGFTDNIYDMPLQ